MNASEFAIECYNRLQTWALAGANRKELTLGEDEEDVRKVANLMITASQFHRDRAEDMMSVVDTFVIENKIDLHNVQNANFAKLINTVRSIHARKP